MAGDGDVIAGGRTVGGRVRSFAPRPLAPASFNERRVRSSL